MPIDVQFKVSNYKKVAEVARRLAGGETYRGYIRDTVTGALQDLTNYAQNITHKETGLLASALTWEYNSHSMRGRLYISPRYVRAQGSTLQWANVYGVYEHDRGGDHAFFERTLRERAPFTAARELNANVRAFDF
jgi:hypothetical protein